MKPNPSVEVSHNAKNHQFEARIDGHKGELVYRLRDGKIYLMHTWVPEEIAGKGVATSLALYALKYAKKEKMETVIYCPFIKTFVARHPDWKEMEY